MLDRQGAFDHRVEGVGHVEHAMQHAPEGSRARLRGEIIRRCAGREKVRADWRSVWDYGERQVLDLSNPFETEERWHKATAPEQRVREVLGDLF